MLAAVFVAQSLNIRCHSFPRNSPLFVDAAWEFKVNNALPPNELNNGGN
jgi:hypothetical protein